MGFVDRTKKKQKQNDVEHHIQTLNYMLYLKASLTAQINILNNTVVMA